MFKAKNTIQEGDTVRIKPTHAQGDLHKRHWTVTHTRLSSLDIRHERTGSQFNFVRYTVVEHVNE